MPLDKEPINARINKTVRMSRSLRLMKLKATVAADPKTKVDQGVGKKHGSYERYLARKKGVLVREEDCGC